MAAGLVAGVGAPGAGAILRTDERLRGDKDEHRMAGVAGTEHRRMEAPDIAQPRSPRSAALQQHV